MPSFRLRLRLALALVLGLAAMAPPLRYLSILGYVRARSEAPSMVRGELRQHHRLALRAIRPTAARGETARVEQAPVPFALSARTARPFRPAPIAAIDDLNRPIFAPRPILSLRLRC